MTSTPPDNPLLTLLSIGLGAASLGLIPLLGMANATGSKKNRNFFVRILIGLAVIVVLLLGGAFIFRGAIGEKFLTILDEQLSDRGVYLEYQASDFDIFSGLVLNDVTLYRTKNQEEAVAQLSKIAINYDLWTILSDRWKKTGASEVNLSTDDAVLTVFHEGQPYLLEGLSGNLTANNQAVDLSSLKGQFAGVNLDFAGKAEFATEEEAEAEEAMKEAEAEAEGEEVAEEPPAELGEGATLPEEPAVAEPSIVADLDLSPVATLAAELGKIQAGDKKPEVMARFNQTADGVLELNGKIQGENFSYQQVALDSLELEFENEKESDPMVLEFPYSKAVYKGKSLLLSGKYDTGSKIFTIEKLESNVDVIGLVGAISGNPTSSGFTLASPPRITLTGTIPVEDYENMALSGKAESSSGAVLQLGNGDTLKLTNMSTNVALKNKLLTLSDFTCQTLGGNGAMRATLTPFAKTMSFDGSMRLSDLSLQEVMELAGIEGERKGKIHGSFTGKGQPGLTTITGSGDLSITEAELTSVPIFGKLKPLISAVLVGGLKKAQLSSTYTFSDGTLKSDDVKMTSGLLSVESDLVDVNFASETLLAEATIKAGPGGLISQVSGRNIEVEASGTFDNFQWKLKDVAGVGSVSSLSRDALINALSQSDTVGKAVDKLNKAVGGSETAGKLMDSGLKALGLGGSEEEEKPEGEMAEGEEGAKEEGDAAKKEEEEETDVATELMNEGLKALGLGGKKDKDKEKEE